MNRMLFKKVLSSASLIRFFDFLSAVQRSLYYCFVNNTRYRPSKTPPCLGPGEEIRGYSKWCEARNEKAPVVYNSYDLKYWPLFSIVVPVYNPDAEWLEACINSVRSQCYAKWELILSDDGSTLAHVHSILNTARNEDCRIRVVANRTREGISSATNKGVEKAKGAFIVFLDHDDILDLYALKAFAIAINENRVNGQVDIIYADEDFFTEDNQALRTPSFKAKYSPDLLLSTNYMHHPVVIRKAIFKHIGGLRSQYDGSQDHDLLLRASEICDLIVHVPDILYHMRVHKGSLASGAEAKPEAHIRDRELISEALNRRRIFGKVVQSLHGHPGQHVVRHNSVENPSFSILIVLERHSQTEPEPVCAIWGEYECLIGNRELPIPQQINQMALEANGQILIVVSSLIRPKMGWDVAVLPHLMRPEIGLVTGKITYPDDTLFSCGLVLGINGTSGAWHRYWYSKQPGISHWLASDHEVSAVPWQFMGIRRELFLSSGGLNIAYRENGFVEDLALKLTTQKKVRHLAVTEAELQFMQDYSKETAVWNESDRNLLWAEWGVYLEKGDPFINPNFSIDHMSVHIGEDFKPDFSAHWWSDILRGKRVE